MDFSFKNFIRFANKNLGKIIIIAFILLWLGFFIVNTFQDLAKINKYEAENEKLSQELQEIEAENKELEAFASQDENALKEEIARQEYGYIYPGERVYVDIAPGD